MVERRVVRRVPTVFSDWLQHTAYRSIIVYLERRTCVADLLIYVKWRLMTVVVTKMSLLGLM